MLSNVNITSSVAVYTQIENQVRFAVAAGKLKAGDQLPSVRELTQRLKVNPNTVSKAYRDLEVMGLVYARRGMGIYIQKGVEVKCRETVRKQIVERLFEVVAEAKASGLSPKAVKAIVEKLSEKDIEPYSQDDSLVRLLMKL